MKKWVLIFLASAMVLSLAACGGEKEKNDDASGVVTSAQADDSSSESPETSSPESTDAPQDGPIAAKGETFTVTVPKLETFIDGYEIVDAGCNDAGAFENIYVKLYKEEPKIEISVSIEQLTISGTDTQDAKGYGEYYNSKNLGPYEPVEIAGYSGYLRAKFSDTTKISDNWYIIDYPLADGTAMVVSLYVGQKYADDTSAVTPIAETFLKNIEVAPNKD